jgi:transcription elongation factor Elf1
VLYRSDWTDTFCELITGTDEDNEDEEDDDDEDVDSVALGDGIGGS